MKNISVLTAFSVLILIVASCKKESCHECHYDLDGQEVELGKKCGDDLENLEKDGYVVDGTIYEVHCHDH
ncbi:MAG TPA: hypothetical protein VKZ44_01050 [Taishania sp.]|nr:hypothetical protein [Taishania sp.]